ncbi:3'-5' exonuclease [Actinomadura geliboluensis]|uniref:3'-5' exonuclease n=1 Tax=Actinomadura geliboluensis TaxID=882440 RepID=UPI0026022E29|nr:3'-5' exonuclease [Actinomadura geliboluensis]
MPQLAIAKDFLAEHARLEKRVQRAVAETIAKFAEHTNAGIHLEKLRNVRDPRIRTIRIDRFWRGVVLAPESGDLYVLLRVLPHDDAIAWASSRRFTVNQVMGVLEVRDEAQLEPMAEALKAAASHTPKRLFDHVSDSDLQSLGIDEQVLPIVRLLTREAHLDALQHILPPLQYDVLVALAAGMTVEQTWDEVSKHLVDRDRPEEVETGDLAAAISRTPDQVALVDGPEELAKILQPPFMLWRIFLHPMQRRIAYREFYPGSIMVTGGAGTGKTVTALHRAAHLAQRYAGSRSAPQILMTTSLTGLTSELGRQLDQLIEDPAVRSRVEVTNIDKVARRIVQERRGEGLDALGTRELVGLATSLGTPYGGQFLVDEWEQVILAQGIRDLDGYLEADRRGRGHGRRLRPEDKREVWAMLEQLWRRMADLGQWSFLEIADEAARLLTEADALVYRHIIVDEAQDLHPAHWRLLRAAVAEGPDDLFVVGDPHQRVWQHRVSMRSTGVNITGGRTRRLTVSYRTTQEILTWAVRLLGLAPADELDGWPDSLEGYESPMHGRRPLVRRFATEEEECRAAAEQVRGWLADGVEPGAIAVAARENRLSGEVAKLLNQAGVGTARAGARGPGVRIDSMHQMKGLEFQCVAVIGVSAGMVPHPREIVPEDVDPAAHRESLQRERCVLYVACTRARDRLYVSYTGAPSPFLPR